ncbi:MAG TPA: hypothetical protein VNJ12_09580 [Candidatus Dormibacteraeota bacterium]|nr:hypothetical protein [Candidatus Dormibacteraeota bacterium]
MRKLIVGVLLLFLGATVAVAANRTFTGQIMDSACAKVGNHDAGYKMTGTHTPKDCTLACVKAGAKFVLYNSATKTIYKLDNQIKPRAFAGENVRVIGSYNPATKTIHVVKIEAAR